MICKCERIKAYTKYNTYIEYIICDCPDIAPISGPVNK